jgi:hypothetical protein
VRVHDGSSLQRCGRKLHPSQYSVLSEDQKRGSLRYRPEVKSSLHSFANYFKEQEVNCSTYCE